MTLHSPFVSRRHMIALALGASAACVLGGCGTDEASKTVAPAEDAVAPDDSSSERADRLRMAIPVDPDGLDPQRTAAAATFEITNNLYDPLVRVTQQNEIIPGLAESWDISDDLMTLTFHLRDGVTFSNGNPCDGDAVVASFERLKADDSPRASEYANYTFEAPDATTVVVTCDVLNVAALSDFAYGWAAIVDTSVADTLANQPVGTGPYQLTSWVPQTSLVLEANPSYWGEAPLTQTVELKVLPDITSQVSSLRAGEIDLMWASETSQVAPFEGDSAFQVLEFPMNGVQLMAMNCANEALADERVRQAINLAVDKDALIDTVWWGYGTKIGSHLPPVLPEYVDLSDTYGYDPEAAQELLEEAGYGDGLTLRMRLPESYPMYVNAGQVVADALSKVGITCDIEIVDWATWLSDVYTGRDYDLTVVGHTGRLDPVTLLARYASTSSENYFNYANPEVDELISAYRTELDADTRTEDVHQIQEILATEVPALYIQTPVMVYLASNKVHGFALYPLDIYEFKNVWIEA